MGGVRVSFVDFVDVFCNISLVVFSMVVCVPIIIKKFTYLHT